MELKRYRCLLLIVCAIMKIAPHFGRGAVRKSAILIERKSNEEEVDGMVSQTS